MPHGMGCTWNGTNFKFTSEVKHRLPQEIGCRYACRLRGSPEAFRRFRMLSRATALSLGTAASCLAGHGSPRSSMRLIAELFSSTFRSSWRIRSFHGRSSHRVIYVAIRSGGSVNFQWNQMIFSHRNRLHIDFGWVKSAVLESRHGFFVES